MYIYVLSKHVGRDVTKVSRWRINTTSRQGIKRLEISFWFYFSSIFLLGATFTIARGSPQPLALDARFHTCGYCSYRSVSCDFKDNFMALLLFPLPPWKWWGINFHEPLRWKGHERSWSMKTFTSSHQYSFLWHSLHMLHHSAEKINACQI